MLYKIYEWSEVSFPPTPPVSSEDENTFNLQNGVLFGIFDDL
jgi:hypothetical protein